MWDCVPAPGHAVGSCLREAVQCTEAASVPCSPTILFPRRRGQRLFVKLSADPQGCPLPAGRRVPEPSALSSFAFVLAWPLLRRSRRAAPVAGGEAGQGRRPALFLKAGPAPPGSERSAAGERLPAAGGRVGVVLAIEGGKPGRRRLPWASGKSYRTAGQMCEGWRPKGDSVWLAGSFR